MKILLPTDELHYTESIAFISKSWHVWNTTDSIWCHHPLPSIYVYTLYTDINQIIALKHNLSSSSLTYEYVPIKVYWLIRKITTIAWRSMTVIVQYELFAKIFGLIFFRQLNETKFFFLRIASVQVFEDC